ncbi:MAG: hypothetical protein K9J17_07000 [Flavobacteriales bacterium]|nr:hypothetical protein [Flavobacteriales bacterium]
MADTLLLEPNVDLTSDHLMQVIGLTIMVGLVVWMFYIGIREAFKKRGK